MSRLKLSMLQMKFCLRRQKVACLKVVYHFLVFSMVKIPFLQKVLKNGQFSEKITLFFSTSSGVGSPDPKVEFSTFFDPSLIQETKLFNPTKY